MSPRRSRTWWRWLFRRWTRSCPCCRARQQWSPSASQPRAGPTPGSRYSSRSPHAAHSSVTTSPTWSDAASARASNGGFFGGERGASRRAWARRALDRYGTRIIILCRFVPGGRTAVTLTCGMVGYRRRSFVVATACAAAIWAAYAFFIGRLGGKAFVDRPWAGFLLALGVALMVSALVEVLRRTRPWRMLGWIRSRRSAASILAWAWAWARTRGRGGLTRAGIRARGVTSRGQPGRGRRGHRRIRPARHGHRLPGVSRQHGAA